MEIESEITDDKMPDFIDDQNFGSETEIYNLKQNRNADFISTKTGSGTKSESKKEKMSIPPIRYALKAFLYVFLFILSGLLICFRR